MYSSARWYDCRSASDGASAGSGTRSVMSAVMPGLVPQVTCGPSDAGVDRRRSGRSARPDRCASSRQRFDRARPTPRPAATSAAPRGYANVVSSGAIMPARAPASMDMLQIVIRPSIERARIASPVYSIT